MSGQSQAQGCVFRIQRHALHDGPGIRTLVFLKGCPLKCAWCFNPESQSPQPQVMHTPGKCLGCDTCLETCPESGALVNNGSRLIARPGICNGCGLCAEACPSGALKLFGQAMSVEQVMQEVLKDRVFYERSGGGVTLSGGEATYQAGFAAALLKCCQDHNLHTALETSGHAPWERFQALIQFVDLLLYDLKIMDPDEHRRLTGVDNSLILRNARLAALAGASMIIRIPLIPGINDSSQNLKQTARFVSDELPGVDEIHLLPYELFGQVKYERLDREYTLSHLQPPAQSSLDAAKALLESRGFRVKLKG